MKVRGSVIKSIDEFVANTHRRHHQQWVDKLPSQTLKTMRMATSSSWHPLKEGAIIPTKIMCDMFYPDANRGAWESGRYSAEAGLTGVYKIFVIISTPAFLLKRASRIMATFYAPTVVHVAEDLSGKMIIHFTQLPVKNELIENRIAGWMEKAMEMCGCKNLLVRITQSMALGSKVFEVTLTWD